MREVDKGSGPAYFTTRTPFANRYWSFYAHPDHALQVVAALPSDAPPGSRAACSIDDPACGAVNTAGWRSLTTISEPSGKASFQIFEKQ